MQKKKAKLGCLTSLILIMMITLGFSGCGNSSIQKFLGYSSSDSQNIDTVKLSNSITELKINRNNIFADSSQKYKFQFVKVYFDTKNENDYKKVVWVSSNPNVATVKAEKGSAEYFEGKISLKEEGQTEIYVQTQDGSVVSNKILLSFGDKFASSAANASTITEMYIDSKDIIVPSKGGATKTINVDYKTSDKNAYKNVVWVISNPAVAKVQTSVGIGSQFSATIHFNNEGVTEIYAQSPDGSVISNKIKLTYGDNPSTEQPQQGSSASSSQPKTIEELELLSPKDNWISSDTKEITIQLKYYPLYKDAAQDVEWFCSDTNVAKIENVKSSVAIYIDAKVTFLSEGQVTIYAKSKNSSVVSNEIVLIHGNKYNKEAATIFNTSQHVFAKLKYNYITGEKPDQIRTAYYKTWYGKDKYNIRYERYTKFSEINCSKVEFSDDNSVVVTGIANTFNANALGVDCNFIVKLKYSDDFKTYEIVSEQYDMPELIRSSIQ